MEQVQHFLVESIKQNNNQYLNVINANHPFPCGICQKNVSNNQKAVFCTSCNLWIHIKCNGTTSEDYNKMIEDNNNNYENISDEWHCYKCVILNRASIFLLALKVTTIIKVF